MKMHLAVLLIVIALQLSILPARADEYWGSDDNYSGFTNWSREELQEFGRAENKRRAKARAEAEASANQYNNPFDVKPNVNPRYEDRLPREDRVIIDRPAPGPELSNSAGPSKGGSFSDIIRMQLEVVR